MSAPAVCPFMILDKYEGNRIFQIWFQQNREWIFKKHGHRVYTSRNKETTGGYEQSWSYYEVDVTILSPNQIRFDTYGMESNVYGGRGELEHQFFWDNVPARVTEKYIERRKDAIAEAEWARRERIKEEERIQREVAAIRAELFGG